MAFHSSPTPLSAMESLLARSTDLKISLRMLPRFQPGNSEINMQLVQQVEEVAAKKGCTPAQLAINWTRELSLRPRMPKIIPIPGATTIVRVEENSKVVDLMDDEMALIDATLTKFTPAGS